MDKIPVVYSADHKKHNPFYLFGVDEHPEKPDRIENILKEIKKLDMAEICEPETVNIGLIKEVHLDGYINFLQSLKKNISNEYRFPINFYHESNRNLIGFRSLLGRYSFDVSTPVKKNTFQCALVSASVSYTAAKLIKDGKSVVYAAGRPPGHHAMKSLMGGFCYLNNAAIAAQYLSKFGSVAVLDVDYHHGNGTQDVFYDRGDVLTVSIHINPNLSFPYYWGFEDEIGVGLGKGRNFNITLDNNIGNDIYHEALERALNKVVDFKPNFLIISLGLDTYENDSIGTFKLTTDYYKKMAQTIKSLNYPTVVIQEGGYYDDLGKNVVSFLSGFCG